MTLLAALGFGVALALAAAGIGRALLARLLPAAAANGGLAVACGLGALAQILLFVALAGHFRAGLLLAGGLLILAVTGRGLVGAWAAVRAALGRPGGRPLAAAGALAGGASVLLALYPPTAWDATIYHLPLARRIVETASLGLADNLRVPIFPLAAETLFAAGLALAGARAAQMVSVLATLATAALLLAWGRERLGASPWGLLPPALWLGHPIVVYYSGTAYVEPLLALFATAAAYALDRWLRAGSPRWLGVSGACAGWAASTKYLALPLVALFGLVLLARARSGARLRASAWFAGAAAAAALPWYGANFVFTGNPVFPFLSGLFGATAWNQSDGPGFALVDRGLGERAVAALRLPWDLLFDRARVGLQPPFSPLVLALPAAAAWSALRAPWTRWLAATLALWSCGYTLLPSDSRYLLAVTPIAGLLVAAALASAPDRLPEVWRRRLLRAAPLLIVATFAVGPLYAAYRVARVGWPPRTAAASAAYLGRELPLYPAIEAIGRDARGPATTYALHAERMIFWNPGRQIGEWNGPFRFSRIERHLGDVEALWQGLREMGADYLLVPKSTRGGDALAGHPGFARRFRPVHEDAAAYVFALRPPAGD